MNILHVLVPVALLLAAAGAAAFWWAVRSGQFDDVETPAIRMLLDDENPAAPCTHTPERTSPPEHHA